MRARRPLRRWRWIGLPAAAVLPGLVALCWWAGWLFHQQDPAVERFEGAFVQARAPRSTLERTLDEEYRRSAGPMCTEDSLWERLRASDQGPVSGATWPPVPLHEPPPPTPAGFARADRELSEVVLLGALAIEDVQRVLDQDAPARRACYRERPGGGERRGGKVVVKFVITGDGTVSTARISRTSLNDPAVEACLCDRIEQLAFPPPEHGIAIAKVPLVFPPEP